MLNQLKQLVFLQDDISTVTPALAAFAIPGFVITLSIPSAVSHIGLAAIPADYFFREKINRSLSTRISMIADSAAPSQIQALYLDNSIAQPPHPIEAARLFFNRI